MKYILFTILGLIFFTASAHAASLSLTAVQQSDATIAVDVIAATDGATINSIEASVSYPREMLTFAGYQEDAGTVRFWIHAPTENNGTVSFAGGIPGGASRTYGDESTAVPLVRLLFVPTQAGTATFTIPASTVLLNDGKGTALSHTKSGTSIAVAVPHTTTATDVMPPEQISVVLVPADHSTNTPMLLTFTARDRDSGIASYAVKIGWGRWHTTQSPYAVSKRLFQSVAKVRVTDTAGNSAVSHIKIPGVIPVPFVVGVIMLCAMLSLGYWLAFMVQKRV